MGFFDFLKKKNSSNTAEQKSVNLQPQHIALGMLDAYDLNDKRLDSILKAVTPLFLYKPPFGYPRNVNVSALRALAKTPYVFAIIKTLADQAACTNWDIYPREDNKEHNITPNILGRDKIKHFLNNPNINPEGFSFLVRAAITDICEVGNAVWVKTFSQNGELVQMFARDGGSFLKNPDIYGSYTNRSDFVAPIDDELQQDMSVINEVAKRDISNVGEFGSVESAPTYELVKQRYAFKYQQLAAYFQYGYSFAAFPIPFGRREIVYMELNPRTDYIYARSPIEVLVNIILTLEYGSRYNLDFYLNNNIPDGLLSCEGATKETIDSLNAALKFNVREITDEFGIKRRLGFKYPITSTKVDLVQFQLKPVDMQVLEQQKWFDRILMQAFGVNENEMGTTDDSNKATAGTQSKIFIRKALKPILDLIAYHINTQILPEFEGNEGWEFRWDTYDLDEDLKKHALYESQIRMGIKTPEMVAKEVGVDIDELKKSKLENQSLQQPFQNPPLSFLDNQDFKKSNEDLNEIKQGIKDIFKTMFEELEKEENNAKP